MSKISVKKYTGTTLKYARLLHQKSYLFHQTYARCGGGGGICMPVANRAGGGGTGLNIGGLGGGGGTGTIGPSPGRIKGTGGGGTLPRGFSFLNANCRKNCFVSLFQ